MPRRATPTYARRADARRAPAGGVLRSGPDTRRAWPSKTRAGTSRARAYADAVRRRIALNVSASVVGRRRSDAPFGRSYSSRSLRIALRTARGHTVPRAPDATPCHGPCLAYGPHVPRQGSASTVCRLRRHLVAVAERRVLRDKRSGNAAPQLLSIDAPFHSELSGNVTAPGFAGSPLRGAVPGYTPPGGGANSLFHSAGAAASGRHGLRRDCLPPPLSPAFGVRPDRPGNAASAPYVNRCHIHLASKNRSNSTPPAEQRIASAAPTAIPSTAPRITLRPDCDGSHARRRRPPSAQTITPYEVAQLLAR